MSIALNTAKSEGKYLGRALMVVTKTKRGPKYLSIALNTAKSEGKYLGRALMVVTKTKRRVPKE
ncbi:MAG: hypothetical protein HFH49_08985 [Lachnospiraceae bacterium]|nr:hypothetical protein [Lachnospiraceae bacterium]